eukprot:CAMPEP_0114993272 /NCGR_PEP_ID=MMETSP0216-20121206/12432_1 /TAXON_ID=223996 /ORGANISM="Protocruzia adherens, Strain Boccale" /LENGTH=165 /DNA_ID=CAMNT_0002356885 /DNA_START=99 /DNA_END=596 /DNA_ORIENTATION=-
MSHSAVFSCRFYSRSDHSDDETSEELSQFLEMCPEKKGLYTSLLELFIEHTNIISDQWQHAVIKFFGKAYLGRTSLYEFVIFSGQLAIITENIAIAYFLVYIPYALVSLWFTALWNLFWIVLLIVILLALGGKDITYTLYEDIGVFLQDLSSMGQDLIKRKILEQ